MRWRRVEGVARARACSSCSSCGFVRAAVRRQQVQGGQVTEATLDDKVLRILTAMFTIGIFDHGSTGSLNNNVTSVAHNQLARELAGKAAVLLQNQDSTLPLDSSSGLKIAMLGSDCSDTPIIAGGGSGHVVAPYIITPLQVCGVRRQLCWLCGAPTAMGVQVDATVSQTLCWRAGCHEPRWEQVYGHVRANE